MQQQEQSRNNRAISFRDAVGAAENFIRRYASYLFLLNAQYKNNTWIVTFRVGVLHTEYVSVDVNGDSGEIIGFSTLRHKPHSPQTPL